MPTIAPFRAAGLHPGQPQRREARAALYLVETTRPDGKAARGLLALLARVGAPTLLPGATGGPAVLRYEDPRGWVEELLWSNAFEEVVRVQHADGEQRVWRIDRPEAVGEVIAQFEDRALTELRAPGPDQPPGSVLAFLVRGDAFVPAQPGGSVHAPADEPVPQAWSGEAGPARWQPPPF